jgi:hypothetical protein
MVSDTQQDEPRLKAITLQITSGMTRNTLHRGELLASVSPFNLNVEFMFMPYLFSKRRDDICTSR